ncbi:hypothetical protein PGT21_012022 [Puccinia graminis f. sp. tritici]|uniref:Transmembrane protein 19 n=1 Tax=Puccinia graminis f. sp. tritici TaxID=56615 RepID=A0A5B0NKK1_PUCGR|nr:hypothetical protein PGT21_012022 [Puccinia graminis f. sp. tritici]
MSSSAQDERISYQAFYPKTFLFSLFVAVYSHRRRSLQLSGAFAANLIGYLTLANPNPIFGGALLSFFTLGTIATKYKQKIKASLVDESDQEVTPHDPSKKKLAVGPNAHPGRDWKQVLCNAWFGTLCALSYSFFDPESSLSNELPGSNQFGTTHTGSLRKALVSAALAYWAGCAGDTFASELGILSRSKPRLITNLKEVPPGTNGAVSLLGLVFSALGGLLVGGVSSFTGEPHQPREYMVFSCGIFGLLCSMIDSVLGAILQQTIYSKNEKRVVAKSKVPMGGTREIVVICGYDLLTNNQVNLISSTATGLLAGLLSYYSIIP